MWRRVQGFWVGTSLGDCLPLRELLAMLDYTNLDFRDLSIRCSFSMFACQLVGE